MGYPPPRRPRGTTAEMILLRGSDTFEDWLRADTLQTYDEWLTTEPTTKDLPKQPSRVCTPRSLIDVILGALVVAVIIGALVLVVSMPSR